MPLPSLEPSARRADQVLESLRAAILDGSIPPGTRLRIRDVAAQLGTSVMPVREAMTRLEEARLIESMPYRGAVVREFTLAEMLDVYAVRRTLEVDAAMRGAARATPDDVGRLELLYAPVRSAIDAHAQVAFLEADEAFLLVLYEAAGNPVLVETVQALWRRSRSYKLFGVVGDWDRDVHLGYQERLIEAVRAHDEVAAGRILAQSIDDATDRIRRELDVPAQ
ncbi:GntR family transcriptional regulator [Microbacterium sp. G2-8]|uniref:GntR family transcriptional regulator n=1 Tax=Microbacterium sp. G2-8 TaxID=2842454 RepID=UPI001C89DF34|nr:GntR family transcriptional regulator [Microbacterium sp. G2-8]